MKIILSLILFISCFSMASFADEIYLNNSTTIKCKIILISDKTIEYCERKEEGGKPFVTIQKEFVNKIVYDDGTVEVISVNSSDKIFLKDGSVINGKIVQITPEVIIYILAGTDKKEAILREYVIKILYTDGTTVQISESEVNPEASHEPGLDESQANKDVYVIHSGGFIDSTFRFALIGSVGFLWGDLHEKEKDSYDRYKNQIPKYPGYPLYDNRTNVYHYGWHGGFELGLLLPSFKFPQKRIFALSGIKLGIVSNYIFSEITQDFNDEALGNDSYSGTLLKYKTVNIGPEMNMIFSPLSNRVNLGIHCYVLGGYVHDGELTALPGSRDAGLPIDQNQYSTRFSGYSGTLGAGLRFISNMAFPVIAGFDLQYTYSKLNFNHAVPVYKSANSASFKEIDFVISIGIHI